MVPCSATANQRGTAWTEPALFDTLRTNIESAILVTSTVRAARSLRQRYDRRQRENGLTGWRSPQILSWEPWLSTLWDAAILAGLETRVLLSEAQELELWRRVLTGDADAHRSLSLEALSQTSQRAWRQMHQYGISSTRLRGEPGLDGQAFYRWTIQVETLCRQSSFMSSSLLEAALTQPLSSPDMALPKRIFLLGFDRVPPAHRQLLDTLTARGCSIEFVEMQPDNGVEAAPSIVCAGTMEEEILAAAQWIRHRLLENPSQRIGVVVPALEKLQSEIDRTFRRVLVPSTMDIHTRQLSLPYEFSLGTPLDRLPLIRTALALLRWLQKPLPPEKVSWLLVQGNFSDSSQGRSTFANDRARLDREFRERKFQLGGSVSLASFRQWLTRAENRQKPSALRRAVEHLALSGQRLGPETPRSCVDWSEAIVELLTAAQWNLLAPSSSAEVQLGRRWDALLAEFASLSAVAGPVRFATVLDRLDRLAAAMLFTLETRHAPVQILGVPESAGLLFDAVWWMNAQASAWPAPGKAQPFLPWGLQRQAHMPHADPAADAAFSLAATERILRSAATVVVSFALEQSGSVNATAELADREILLSPLVRTALPGTSIVNAEDFLEEVPEEQDWSRQAILESVHEEPAVPFQATRVRGGVRFLELQAACPFRAFAELRLGARPLDEAEMGLSAAARGTIVHRVLERFWTETQSQAVLLSKTAEQNRRHLRRHIDEALAEFSRHANEPWQGILLQIEAERLEQRLLDWLEQEKLRSDFTVLETENALDDPRLGDIEFQCRIDRIDRVAQGIVLLDYKTGQVDRNACDGERPDQPQLPAYAVLRTRQDVLAGVAFASLHPRNVGFTVIGSRPGIFSTAPKNAESQKKSKPNAAAFTPEDMQVQQQAWRAVLTGLAEQFRAGMAIVDPKKHEETCRYCAQSVLCRIQESRGANE